MKPVIRTSPETYKFSGLLDCALPLLASGWQAAALHIVTEMDRDALSDTQRRGDAPRPPAKTIELGLVGTNGEVGGQDNSGALDIISPRHIRLRFPRLQESTAAAALLACAVQSDTPIAGDNQTLALCTLTERLGTSDIPVLIGGPSGTGKEVFARFLHRVSPRSEHAFVAVNCAAMPEAMLEALLFGHKKGAFTGAIDAGEGLFRAADKGTLLLDEIGEMPQPLQAKLLRTLQEGEVLPLGATKPIPIDVRIIACTNRDLAQEVEQGRFREDLFYRLNVFPMRLPALRERPGDIAPLAFGMLLRHACRKGLPNWLADNTLQRLLHHPWPGNVRELENVIRRAILLAGDERVIAPEHIRFDASVRSVSLDCETGDSDVPNQKSGSLSDVAFRSEAQAIIEALDRCEGHRGKTAKVLGISERTLRYRLASMRETGLLKAGAHS